MTRSTEVNSRRWLIGGAIFVLVAGGVSYLLIGRGAGSRSGRDRERDSASQSRHASAASHREALTAIKDGHFVQALGFYRTLSDERVGSR